MKALSRKLKKSDESKKLIPSEGSNNPSYNAATSDGNGQRSRKTSAASGPSAPNSPKQMRRTTSSSSGGATPSIFDVVPMVQIRAGQYPSPPSSPRVEAVLDLDFDKVPFQFYTRESDSWNSAFMQASILVAICSLVPSLFIIFAMIGNHIRMKFLPKMTDAERRNAVLFLVVLFVMTLTKDLIIVMVVLHVVFSSSASNYEIGYSPVVFCWSLILFAFPLTVFYFAEAKYIFGFDSAKKKLSRAFAALLSSKAKTKESNKVDEQEKYFITTYKALSSINKSGDEFAALAQWTSKSLLITSMSVALLVSIVHCLIPLFLQLLACLPCHDEAPIPTPFPANNTTNTSLIHVTKMITNTIKNANLTHNATKFNAAITKTVIGLSTANSFLVSLFACTYFVYITLWNIAMLKEWKGFNKTESNSGTTLVNSGPQGIAMWWKVRQTLKLFSTTNLSMSVIVTKMACVVVLIAVTSLSLALIFGTVNIQSSMKIETAIPLMMDNVLLYLALLIIGCLAFKIREEKDTSGRIVELKQLNVSFELGRLMNLEQDVLESEPGIRVKTRVMRGCLMLLQELSSTMENVEKNASSQLIVYCVVLGTLIMFPCVLITGRFFVAKATN